jgi:hypothetical protein
VVADGRVTLEGAGATLATAALQRPPGAR